MQKIYLELTDSCNLDCLICYRKSWNKPFIDMNNALFERLINQIEKMDDLKEIVLGGIGEPTSAPLFRRAVEQLKEKRLILTTNGIFPETDFPEILVPHVDEMIVSVDGGAEKFRELRGADLNLIIENLQKINTLKRERSSPTPEVNIQFVLSTDNRNEIWEVIDIAEAVNAENVIISNLLPQDEKTSGKILYTRYENPDIKEYFNRVRNYGLKKHTKITTPHCELKTERRCAFIENDAAYITATGDVVPCYRFSHDGTEYVFGRKKEISRHSFGSIDRQTLAEIWDSRSYTEFRRKVLYNLYPSCIDCDLVDGCDIINTSHEDCFGINPSCADCLWCRKLVLCP